MIQRKCKPSALKLVYIAEAKPFFCKSTKKKTKSKINDYTFYMVMEAV